MFQKQPPRRLSLVGKEIEKIFASRYNFQFVISFHICQEIKIRISFDANKRKENSMSCRSLNTLTILLAISVHKTLSCVYLKIELHHSLFSMLKGNDWYVEDFWSRFIKLELQFVKQMLYRVRLEFIRKRITAWLFSPAEPER